MFGSAQVYKLIAILEWAGNKEIDKTEEVNDTIDRVYAHLVEEGQLMGEHLE